MAGWKHWKDGRLVRTLAARSAGRRILSAVGPRFAIRAVEGFPMALDLCDRWGVSKYILKHGDYDPGLCRTVERLVRPGAVCLDVGANIGFWTCFMARRLKARTIFAFEPEPFNQSLFEWNVGLNEATAQTKLFKCAVGDKAGQLELFLSPDNAGDHQLYRSDEARASIKTPVVTIDGAIPNDARVDFVKIDVQGYEPYAFRGMSETLARSQDAVILTEFWPAGIARAGEDPERALRFFGELGLRAWAVDERSGGLNAIALEHVVASAPKGHHLDLLLSRRRSLDQRRRP